MKEINYILKRVLQMIPVLLLVMVLIFALIRFIPGDPADVMLGARATEESRAMLHAKMGIDKPIYEQFFLFMKNCLRLDFGESIPRYCKERRHIIDEKNKKIFSSPTSVRPTLSAVHLWRRHSPGGTGTDRGNTGCGRSHTDPRSTHTLLQWENHLQPNRRLARGP
ncbi:MAG: hypothetical protein ACLR9K_00890 [Blautia sp.]